MPKVYPGTEWAASKNVAIPGGPDREALAALAKAYQCEHGVLNGVQIFRKQRPWEQPAIGPEVEGGPVVATRVVWDGAIVCDLASEVTCQQARLGLVLGKLGEWRTPDVGYFLRTTTDLSIPHHTLVHPDFGQRRLFVRVRDMTQLQFEQALAACVGATITGTDYVVLARSPGMAWRGALADYEERGPPDFASYVRSLDPAFPGLLGKVRPQDVLLLELLRRTTPFESRRLANRTSWSEGDAQLEDVPGSRFIVQEYPTVSFGFEELPRIAQLAVIALIKAEDADPERPPHLHFDAQRPDRIIVTLRRSGAGPGEPGRLICTVAYPMRNGITMVR